MIVAAVGTFLHGFDELVEATDRAVATLGLDGFAQVGHGRYLPLAMPWSRFLPRAAFAEKLGQATLVICHGGMGILGDAMRAGRPIVAVPRRGATSRTHPANDQRLFLERLAQRWPIEVCDDPAELTDAMAAVLQRRGGPLCFRVDSDVPSLIAGFLAGGLDPRR